MNGGQLREIAEVMLHLLNGTTSIRGRIREPIKFFVIRAAEGADHGAESLGHGEG
jgi:hypothetical protein